MRAVAGEKTAFAYSDDISLAALEDAAARHARDRRGRRRTGACEAGRKRARRRQPRCSTAPTDPIATLDSDADKVALLERLETLRPRARPARRAGDGRRSRGEYDVVLVARADGTLRRRRAPAGARVGAP